MQPGPQPVSWHKDVEPLVQRKCGTCHEQGGIAPFTLKTLEDWKAVEPLGPRHGLAHGRSWVFWPTPTARDRRKGRGPQPPALEVRTVFLVLETISQPAASGCRRSCRW